MIAGILHYHIGLLWESSYSSLLIGIGLSISSGIFMKGAKVMQVLSYASRLKELLKNNRGKAAYAWKPINNDFCVSGVVLIFVIILL
ncbi:uncharacterized protein [Rutidosis leptorrhynchoides]|uniref:uncharacterized protein isoform X2 n=1 Tax=Rutidosis leptorrhynchoides TaxID=125765 RepID=UPI003A9A4872